LTDLNNNTTEFESGTSKLIVSGANSLVSPITKFALPLPFTCHCCLRQNSHWRPVKLLFAKMALEISLRSAFHVTNKVSTPIMSMTYNTTPYSKTTKCMQISIGLLKKALKISATDRIGVIRYCKSI